MPPAVVVFDLFGTLLDISSLRSAIAPLCDDPAAFVATWREKQIAYAFASAVMDRYEDFDAITGYALQYAAAKYDVRLGDAQHAELVRAWAAADAYPDARAAVDDLRAAGHRCAVLTNGTPVTSHAALERSGLAPLLDDVLFVGRAGVYKPDHRVYALVTERYAVAADDVVFVTSNGWDATGATAFGFRVAWCNRGGAPAETFGPPPRWTIAGLDALAALL
jgi:2-haloacid dehalogenase